MTDETTDPKPRRTRRPLSLTDKLLELRDQKRRALAERTLRLERLDMQRRELVGQVHVIEAELERVRLALGEARDNEREDISAGGMDLSGPPADPHDVVVAVVPGTGGAPPTAAVVDVDPARGTVEVVSQHDTVAHAVGAINGQAAP